MAYLRGIYREKLWKLRLVPVEYEYFCFPCSSSFKQALEALPQLSSGTDKK